MALRRVLVAARGEAASRIARACRDENIEPVFIATTADADEAFATTPSRLVAAPEGATLKDLAAADIVRLAHEAGCDSVHPGFGGVAEAYEVASAVESGRLQWVGPPADLIAALVDSETATGLMDDYGLPIAAIDADLTMRYVDVSVIADSHGSVVHFAEHCCTVSAAGFPLVVESPGDQFSRQLRTRIAAAAVLATRCLGYVNAGTIRFQVGVGERFGFVSMTPRLHRAHAIAEVMTGMDLVRLQLRVAGGERSGLVQEHIKPRGHVICVKVHVGGPGSGRLIEYREPTGPGIRVESALAVGTRIASQAMPAVRVIVSASDRAAAVLRVQQALDSLVIEGVPTDLEVIQHVTRSQAFQRREPVVDAGGAPVVKWLAGGDPAPDELLGSAAPVGALPRY